MQELDSKWNPGFGRGSFLPPVAGWKKGVKPDVKTE
jgi:hypothetical protein